MAPPVIPIKAKKVYYPYSSWVHAVILTCDDLLALWFKENVFWEGRDEGWGSQKYARKLWMDWRFKLWSGGVPGACCLYPKAPGPKFYDAILGAYSAGHFVWYTLPITQPYLLVAPPRPPFGQCAVPTACCANALPATLFLTYSAATGGAVCFPAALPLVYSAAAGEWQATFDSCGGPITAHFHCIPNAGGSFGLSHTGFVAGGQGATPPLSCLPFAWSLGPLNITGSLIGTITAAVTT